jgi:hypothetical protein
MMSRNMTGAEKALSIVVAALTVAIPAPAQTIQVDGSAGEWSAIPALYTATTSQPNTAQYLKVTNDTANLYILVAGTSLAVKSQFFIDADDNYSSGYHASGFNSVSTESTGAEYMVENNILYKYTGPQWGTGRTAWSWSQVGTVTIVKTGAAIELSIPLASLGIVATQKVGVAYIKNDSAYDRLPSADDYFTVRKVDLSAPSAPSALAAQASSDSAISLSWAAATDNVAVAGYEIYRNNVKVGTAAGASYADTGLTASTSYSYTLKAYDAKGNLSAQSAAVSASTLAAPAPPAIPPASTGNWEGVRNYLVNYTPEANINKPLFAKYDAAVLEPQVVSAATVAALKGLNPKFFAIGYISIGETLPLLTDANGARLDIYFIDPATGNPLQNPDWHGYYVDDRKPAFHDLVLNTWLPAIFAKGYDGVFLDTADTSAYVNPALNIDFRPSAVGMQALIQEMKAKFPTKKIIMNRGYHLLGGEFDVSGVIDGVMLESYTTTWASAVKNADGSSNEDYHAEAPDSSNYLWSEGITSKINKLRFQYNADGTVMRDADGKPTKSANYFLAMPLDYARDESVEQKALMQLSVERAWANHFVPSIGVKRLDLPPAYDWLLDVTMPAESAYGSMLDIPTMPVPNPAVIDDFAALANWKSLRGQTEPLPAPGPDVVTLSDDGGAARLDVTVQGTKAWTNGALLQSREWFQPVDLTHGFVTLNAKVSAPLGANKAFQVEIKDYNNDVKAWSLTPNLGAAWSTFSLDLVNGGVYYAGWDGAGDGFQADKVKSIQIKVMNTLDNSETYTGTLWLDNLLANQGMPVPNPLIDDFSDGVGNWVCNPGALGDTCALQAAGGAGRMDMNLLGTTAWANALVLQSRDWFVPVDFTNRSLTFQSAVSASLAGSGKSVQVLLVDSSNNTKGWDITASLTTSPTDVTIHPLVGGSESVAPGTLFQLNSIKSIRFLAINTMTGSTAYTGSLMIDNVASPATP